MRATYAQIDLSAIAHNVSLVKKNAGQAEMMAVVKADAYGHGAIPVARTALENGAKWLAVATAEEAEELRDAGFICPVLVLGALDEEDCALCVARGISVSVSNAEQLRWMHQAAKRENTTAKAHLKIDTGFHRLGAVPEQLPSLLEACGSRCSRRCVCGYAGAPLSAGRANGTAGGLYAYRPHFEQRSNLEKAGIKTGYGTCGHHPIWIYAQRRDAGKGGSMACYELEKHGVGYPYHRAGRNGGVWPYLYCA